MLASKNHTYPAFWRLLALMMVLAAPFLVGCARTPPATQVAADPKGANAASAEPPNKADTTATDKQAVAPKADANPQPANQSVAKATNGRAKAIPGDIVEKWIAAEPLAVLLGSPRVYAWHGEVNDGRPVIRKETETQAGDLPGFQLATWKPGLLAKLPPPPVPFALSLKATRVTRAELEGMVLAGLKTNVVAVLDPNPGAFQAHLVTTITDETLGELGGFQELRSLDLESAAITDAGLKELAVLKELRRLNLFGTRVTDAALRNLAGLRLRTLVVPFPCRTDLGLKHYVAALESPRVLNLSGWREVTDTGIGELAALTQLQTLSLGRTQVTDAGLKHLAGLKELRWLGLCKTQVTDAGLKDLAAFKQLGSLSLNHTQVTDAGLKELVLLKHLRTLSLVQTEVTDKGLKELASLKELRHLDLAFTNVTDTGLKGLVGFKELGSLSLWGTPVTDAGLNNLASLSELRALSLSGTKVTDVGLEKLAGLKQLRLVDVSYTPVTSVGMQKLETALPSCLIYTVARAQPVLPNKSDPVHLGYVGDDLFPPSTVNGNPVSKTGSVRVSENDIIEAPSHNASEPSPVRFQLLRAPDSTLELYPLRRPMPAFDAAKLPAHSR